MTFSTAKTLVLSLYENQQNSDDSDWGVDLDRFYSIDLIWRGFHPFGELSGFQKVNQTFWTPLRNSLKHLQRRQDIFFAGQNSLTEDSDVWVVSMGHLAGLFDEPWLGIPPTGKLAMLRYCEFNRVSEGKIVETAMYFDIPHLMVQAGLAPFRSQTAVHMVQPGPMTHDGLLFDDQPAAEGDKTQAVINKMVSDIGQWGSKLSLEDELARTWHDDMLWWGPEGIGATYTIARYAKQHAGPFRAAFTDRSKVSHICRTSEGHYGGFFGWPNFTATPKGEFQGLPTADQPSEFRVIDIYRRSGDKLAENWIFIDMLHFWKQQGIDILAEGTKP